MRKGLGRQLLALAAGAAALALTTTAMAADVSVQWFGQAAFKIMTPGGKTIVIDPFITKNPKTPEALKDLAAIGKVDLILVTHGHGDHVGDTVKLAELTGAKVAMNADMGSTFAAVGLLKPEQLIRFNKSGPIKPLDGITVTMTHAEHSSSVAWTDPVSGKQMSLPGGEPAGYVVELENGFKLYHAGDTGVFGDMTLIGEIYRPDVALLPIGGHFTMDPAHAAYAASRLLKIGKVIPMHYGTFPPLKGTPAEFKAALGDASIEVLEMAPGDTLTF
ncbi:MAG: metal-dependent hydrolase [Pseudomonadota bacterium]|nr:metal-dependent hydrolase [Pseudomonadota bacterium]